MTREEIMTIIENELRTMDTMSLRIVWAFIRGLKKRSRRLEE